MLKISSFERLPTYEQKIPPAWKGRKYRLRRSENYGALMKAMGYGPVERKVTKKISTSVQLIKQGDNYIWKVLTPLSSKELSFKPGEHIEQRTLIGPSTKSVFEFDGDNRLIHTRYLNSGKCVIENEFSENELIQTISFNHVVCKQLYTVV